MKCRLSWHQREPSAITHITQTQQPAGAASELPACLSELQMGKIMQVWATWFHTGALLVPRMDARTVQDVAAMAAAHRACLH